MGGRKDVSVRVRHVLGRLLPVLLLVVITTISCQELFPDPGTSSYRRPFAYRAARAPVRMPMPINNINRLYGCKCARLYQLASWILDMRSNDY